MLKIIETVYFPAGILVAETGRRFYFPGKPVSWLPQQEPAKDSISLSQRLV